MVRFSANSEQSLKGLESLGRYVFTKYFDYTVLMISVRHIRLLTMANIWSSISDTLRNMRMVSHQNKTKRLQFCCAFSRSYAPSIEMPYLIETPCTMNLKKVKP